MCLRPAFAAIFLLLLSFAAAGCSSGRTVDDIGLSLVTLPNGTRIQAETMRDDIELIKGLMFRESMAKDHGMLFVHPEESTYHYWMYQTKIPLDIVWMDHDRRVVEMSLDTPPCKATSPRDCTNYGGNYKSKYVLEVNAGVARKAGVKVGDTIDF